MPCKNYECGRCLAQPREVTRTGWVGFLAVQKHEVVYAPCTYTDEVWVGGLCFQGALGGVPAKQNDCALYAPVGPLKATSRGIEEAKILR
jgi:hypothetical protein